MFNDEETFSNASIQCKRTGHVLSFQILRNRITYQSLSTIESALKRVRDDATIRAVALLLRADGSDPDSLGEVPERFAHRIPHGKQGHGPIIEQAALRAMREFTKPLLAFMRDEVNGIAIDIAAACDIRVANTSLTMCDTRILQGRTASTGIAYLLPKLVGQSQAMRILLLGERLTAAEAERIHFIHRVVEDVEFDAFVDEFSASVAGMATRAWQVHKMQVLGQQHLDFESAMIHSLGIRQTHVINDRVEGINAWRERRKPEFRGT